MNAVQLVGRLVREPDVKYSQDGRAHARITLAVDRRFRKEGEQNADFISCVAFGKTAEFIEKYFHKGMRMGLTGRIQTASYKNQQGNMIYTTDVICENIEFVESKKTDQAAGGEQQAAGPDGFMSIPDQLDDDNLPFS